MQCYKKSELIKALDSAKKDFLTPGLISGLCVCLFCYASPNVAAPQSLIRELIQLRSNVSIRLIFNCVSCQLW